MLLYGSKKSPAPPGVNLPRLDLFRHEDRSSGSTGAIQASDGALMDVAPSRACVLEQDDDGMVGFFVVCLGVLAG